MLFQVCGGAEVEWCWGWFRQVSGFSLGSIGAIYYQLIIRYLSLKILIWKCLIISIIIIINNITELTCFSLSFSPLPILLAKNSTTCPLPWSPSRNCWVRTWAPQTPLLPVSLRFQNTAIMEPSWLLQAEHILWEGSAIILSTDMALLTVTVLITVTLCMLARMFRRAASSILGSPWASLLLYTVHTSIAALLCTKSPYFC